MNHQPLSAAGPFNRVLHLMRGIAIFLVVFEHALGPTETTTRLVPAIIAVVFTFHMPLFFFVSGFLGRKFFECDRSACAQVVARQFKRLMVVYFFYSALAILVKLATQGYVHRPIEPSQLLSAIFLYPHDNPLLVLWFLYSLFMIQMAFLAWHVLFPVKYTRWLPVCLVLGVLIAANLVGRNLPHQPLALNYVAKFSVYFFLGFLASRHAPIIESLLRPYRRTLLVFGLGYFSSLHLFDTYLHTWGLPSLFLALIGIALTWAASLYLAERPRTGLLALVLNRLSDYAYEIYLNSGFFHTGVRIILGQVLAWHVLAVFPIDLLIALVAPILLSKYLYRRIAVLRKLAVGDWKS